MTLKFPEDFLWGAATAAYQIEGSPLADGAGMSIWHRFSHTPGTVLGGDTGDVACDHYRRYREDVRLMRQLGLRAYRFSVSWPRVMPEGRGRINEAGMAFYEGLIDALAQAGIMPFVTLYHWDLPAALQDKGGWCNRDVAEWFAEYANALFTRFGDRVKHWITLNEPWVVAHLGHVSGQHAPGMRDVYAGLRAAHHLLLAHGRAVAAFRAGGRGGQIGIAVNLGPQHPATQSPEDVAAAARAHAYQNELFLNPIFTGRYPQVLQRWFGEAWPEARTSDLDEIHRPIDFVGVNYYSGTVLVHAANEDLLHAKPMPRDVARTAMGWEIHPPGLHEIVLWVHGNFGAPAIYITENGAAFEDRVVDGEVRDEDRVRFLRAHLKEAHRAIADGVPLRGYFAWSLMDNFEWACGYSRRFGLVYIDYGPQRRIVKQSGYWYRDVIATNGLEAAGPSTASSG